MNEWKGKGSREQQRQAIPQHQHQLATEKASIQTEKLSWSILFHQAFKQSLNRQEGTTLQCLQFLRVDGSNTFEDILVHRRLPATNRIGVGSKLDVVMMSSFR